MQVQSVSLRKLCRIASKRNSSRVKDAATLCTRCSAIRLRLEANLPASDDLVFLGSLKDLEERQDCALCRVVLRSLSACRKSATDKGDIQCVLNPRPGCGESFALECRHALSSSTSAWIRIDCPPGILQGLASLPCPLRHLNSSQLEGTVARSLLIDPEKIRNWLKECETWHQEECATYQLPSHKKKTEDLLLIDVVDNMLVDGDQDFRYIALSYVMGGFGGATVTGGSWSKYDYLRTKGALRRSDVRLPETLRDAIELTRSIGERYLWCDAICVFEDGEGQRMQQLGQMDVIYSRALFTIIALSGKHGDQALPGVRSGSRGPGILAEEVCGGLRFLSWAASLGTMATGSEYESRGWTFQERLLSRRCLFISERQVFFQCGSRIVREDEEVLGHPTQAMARSIGRSQETGLGPMLKAMDPFSLYAYLVSNYTDRRLTKPEDVLDAFKGITAALEGPFRANFVDGLPSSHFRHALMWTPESRIRRRFVRPEEPESPLVVVPSWSWAAWVGQVRYGGPDPAVLLTTNGENHLLHGKGPQSFVIISMLQIRTHSWVIEYKQGIAQNVTQYHEWDDQRQQSPGSQLFLQHFAVYGFVVIDALMLYFHRQFPSLFPLWRLDGKEGYLASLAELKLEVEDFFQSHQWLLSDLPFSSMPSFEEFRRMINYYSGPKSNRLDCWPFTHISHEESVAAAMLAQDEAHGPESDTAVDCLPAWPFQYVPHQSSLSRVTLESPPKEMDHLRLPRLTAMGTWVFISRFDPRHLLDGQLFRNTFSRSLQYTTQDGSLQCDVEQLIFSVERGVAAGQQGQPATLLRNDLGEPYGIVLDHEEDVWQRCQGLCCYFVPLHDLKTPSGARRLAFMLVAERAPPGCYERLAIAHLDRDGSVEVELKSRYEYICLM